jgi:predicted transcriptional regulator
MSRLKKDSDNRIIYDDIIRCISNESKSSVMISSEIGITVKCVEDAIFDMYAKGIVNRVKRDVCTVRHKYLNFWGISNNEYRS